MKISLICVEDALLNMGFRKFAAYVNKTLNYNTDIYYAAHGDNYRSYKKMIFGTWGQMPENHEERARRMAEPVADADVIGLSSMTQYAPLTKKIINHIRSVNPNAYIVWGGIHPIIEPEDAIQHADAICTGEGEFAFEEFITKFSEGTDFTNTKNFWFNLDGEIIRNSHRPLMTKEEMDDLPLLQYGEGEKIYREGRGYVETTPKIYREYNGLGYNAIWTIGCPLHCTFCANTKFIDNHSNYTQVRHPSPSYIVDEIEQALEVHPFLQSVTFYDDSFAALSPDTLRAFRDEWQERLDLPFTVLGVIPNYVTKERMEILLDAGMNRMRMGIQNGSQEILEFYKRPAPPERVKKSAEILHQYEDYMIPPAYDIIVDNPVETRKNVIENIELLRSLPGSYNLNVFSLTTIPNTELEDQLEKRNLTVCSIRDNNIPGANPDLAPTLANCLIYLIATFPIPDWIYRKLLERAKPAEETETFHPWFMVLCRFMHYVKRGLHHLRFLEFSIVGGSVGYFLWKIGLLDPLRNLLTPEFNIEEDTTRVPQKTPESERYTSAQ